MIVPRYSSGVSFLLILLCSAIFSTEIIASRLSGQLYDPFVVALFVWGWAGLALSAYIFFVGGGRQSFSVSSLYNVVLYATFALLLPSTLSFLAGRTTTALNMTVIYSSTPVVVYIMVTVTGGERMRLWRLVGLLVSTLGVGTALYYGGDGFTDISFHEGDLLAMLAVLSWAIYAVHIAGKKTALTASERLWLASWFCTAVLFCFALATGRLDALGHVPLGFFFLTAFVALMPCICGYLLHAHLTRTVGAARVGLMSYLVPLTASLQAMLLLSETLRAAQIPAAGMVLLGVWIAGR